MRETCLENINLICPCCRQAGRTQISQSPLKLNNIISKKEGYVLEGFLLCSNPQCLTRFPIVAGVPIVLKNLAAWYRTEHHYFPVFGSMASELASFFRDLDQAEPDRHNRTLQLNAYLDSHFSVSDNLKSKNNHGNELFWHQLIESAAPTTPTQYSRSLDLGCSVGRFTFELARFSDLAIGLDIDFQAVATAARFQRSSDICFHRPERSKKAPIYSSPIVPQDNMLFLVADAMDPPFEAENFDLVSGVNLLDNVSVPLMLLGQMNALLRQGGILHHCSPYAWRANISDPVEWLETEDIAAPDLMRKILTEQFFPELNLQYEILTEIEKLPWILNYGLRQKSIFSVHLLIARKISGCNN